jgi:hypothetical protein
VALDTSSVAARDDEVVLIGCVYGGRTQGKEQVQLDNDPHRLIGYFEFFVNSRMPAESSLNALSHASRIIGSSWASGIPGA